MGKNRESCFIVSFLTIRRLIGILGMLLPVLLILGSQLGPDKILQKTVSNYYYTNVQDLLIGTLSAVAVFLLCYQGYRKWFDRLTSIAAGIGALGVVLFPMNPKITDLDQTGIFNLNVDLSDKLHVTSASVFFVVLAVISLFIFTINKNKKKTPEKKIRNIVYIVCGSVILVSLILIVIYAWFDQKGTVSPVLAGLQPLFWLESIALVAFGFSWLVKGETLWKDKH